MSTIAVSNQAQLDAAITKAVGGDVIQLAAGAYNLTVSKAFTSNVTITSAEANNPARIGYAKLTNASNVTIKSVEIGRSLTSSETVEGAFMARVTGSSNITFDSVHVHGSLDNYPGNDGIGLYFNGSSGIKVVNSEFEQLGRGAVFGGSTNITVSNNDFHDVRSDGMQFQNVQNVVLDSNSFKNFQRASADHPDAIQFFTTGSSTSSANITIRNNVVMTGSGTGMQGIFLRDETGNLPYKNVVIENNFVLGTNMPNGIYVEGGQTVLNGPRSSYRGSRRRGREGPGPECAATTPAAAGCWRRCGH